MKIINRMKSRIVTLQSKKSSRLQSGMSLMELMLVLVILGIVATIIMNSVSGAGDKAKAKASKVAMGSLASTIELEYKMEKNDYPQDLQTLLSGQYINKIPKDGWGEELIYQKNEDNSGFKLISKGKDKKIGTQYDIIEKYPKE